MKYLKKFESHEELLDILKKFSNQVERISKFSQFQNRNRLVNNSNVRTISEDFKDYFYTMTDDGWEYYLDYSQFYIKVVLKKPIKKDNAENEFNNIVDNMSEIKDRLSQEGFNSHFLVFFNNKAQQELNTKTHQNNLYKYNGIGDGNLLQHSSQGSFKIKFNSIDYFLGKVELVII